MKEEKPKREHYEYEKLGSCVLMVAVDPKAGWRFAKVFERRLKREYARFMKELADYYAASDPEVRRVHLVQDNLNTHHAGAFYEQYDAETAHRLEQFYQFHYTPKKASWLNMAEIEPLAISRQCLSRRIASRELLERGVLALAEKRNEKQIPIVWTFSLETARQKLNRRSLKAARCPRRKRFSRTFRAMPCRGPAFEAS